MTIFALNIMPYISSSIIMQLMTAVSPQLEALKKEGETGRKKINQYTRYGTVLIAAFQAYGISAGLEGMSSSAGPAVTDPGMFFRFQAVLIFNGRCELSPPVILVPRWRFGYWTMIRRWARSTKTMK